MEQKQTEPQPPWMAYHPGQNWPTESLTIVSVMSRTGMTKSSWYRAIGAGRAPAARLRGGRAVWDSREIEAWNRWQMDTLPRRAS
jgi:predicted DNA-binding transcriptional regulator AlpA